MKQIHLNEFKVDWIRLNMNWFYIFGFFTQTNLKLLQTKFSARPSHQQKS